MFWLLVGRTGAFLTLWWWNCNCKQSFLCLFMAAFTTKRNLEAINKYSQCFKMKLPVASVNSTWGSEEAKLLQFYWLWSESELKCTCVQLCWCSEGRSMCEGTVNFVSWNYLALLTTVLCPVFHAHSDQSAFCAFEMLQFLRDGNDWTCFMYPVSCEILGSHKPDHSVPPGIPQTESGVGMSF